MTKNFYRPAKVMIGRDLVNLFIDIEERKPGTLSISGVEGPMSNGDARGGCGQIDMHYAHRNPEDNDYRTDPKYLIRPDQMQFAPGWNAEMWLDLLDIWSRWHLNDMRPGCEHQRNWPTGKQLELQELTWGDAYHDARRLAEDGEMSTEAYATWRDIVTAVESVSIEIKGPKHPDLWSEDDLELIETGYLKLGKKEIKGAGWVYPSEHPEGLLTKPCPECGYKYGSAWRFEAIPAEVIEFINNLPEADVLPPMPWQR